MKGRFMNIALVLFRYFPYGGLQRDFYRIAEACLERGHQVTVFCYEWDGPLLPGVSIQLVPVTAASNHKKAAQFSKRLKKLLSEQSFEVVLGFNKMPGLDYYYAADVCYQEKALAKYGVACRLMSRYRQYVGLEKSIFSKESETTVLLLSETEKEKYQSCYHTQDARFVILPPNGSKTYLVQDTVIARHKGINKRESLGIRDDQFLLLQVGSGFRTKGLDRAIKCLASLPDKIKSRCCLLVVGQDNEKPYERLAERLGVSAQVVFLGARDDVPELMLAADVLIHLAYSENTGTVLLEGVMSGLPVFTTSVCGYATHVKKSHCGHVLDAPFDLSVAIAQLEYLLEPKTRFHCRQEGWQYARSEDLFRLPEAVVDVLEKSRSVHAT
jgi:UDP-glucose:(heptosyl)LPS alpha-1,3-glucosyltransferase